ncbi:MFS transporter [Streptomyces sp. NPDC005373]|uniref:MFS transporter n=1 Tax=Streptomyces sp. NPDC005373 TaxID=3156879 RepID=UPI0033BC0477
MNSRDRQAPPSSVAELVRHEADPLPPRVGLVRIGLALTASQTAVYVTLNAVVAVLLPVKIVQVVGETHKESWLGIISSAGAVVSILAGPVIGSLSDRTRHRLGRRAPWLLAGGAGSVVAFGAVGLAPGPVPLLLASCLSQLTVALVLTPINTVLPERVPLSRRGTISGVTGLATTIAAASAGWAGAAFVDDPALGTTLLGALVLVGTVAFVLLAPERSSSVDAPPQRAVGRQPLMSRSMFASFSDHNFRWVCVGRLLVVMAYQVLQARMLYFVKDRFDLSLRSAATTVGSVTAIAGVLTVIGLVASGPLSDRFGRRPFVCFGSAGVGLGLLLVTQVSSVSQFIAAWAVASLAFGSFVGVDGALTADVLPAADSVGRDLGVVGLAQTLPQTVAPALGSAVLAATGSSYTILLVGGAISGFAAVGATLRLRGVR